MMIRTNVFAAVAAVLLLASQPAEAAGGWRSGMNGQELMDSCVDLGNNGPCITFIFGIADMLSFPNAEYTWRLKGERRPVVACIPVGEIPGKVVSEVVLHIQDHMPQSQRHLPAFGLVLSALTAQYPCNG